MYGPNVLEELSPSSVTRTLDLRKQKLFQLDKTCFFSYVVTVLDAVKKTLAESNFWRTHDFSLVYIYILFFTSYLDP